MRAHKMESVQLGGRQVWKIRVMLFLGILTLGFGTVWSTMADELEKPECTSRNDDVTQKNVSDKAVRDAPASTGKSIRAGGESGSKK